MNLKLEINLLMNQLQQAGCNQHYEHKEAVLSHLRNEIARMNSMPEILHPLHVISLHKNLEMVLPYRGHLLRPQCEQRLTEIIDFARAKFYKKPLPVTTGNL